jgi:hypothetical protein
MLADMTAIIETLDLVSARVIGAWSAAVPADSAKASAGTALTSLAG